MRALIRGGLVGICLLLSAAANAETQTQTGRNVTLTPSAATYYVCHWWGVAPSGSVYQGTWSGTAASSSDASRAARIGCASQGLFDCNTTRCEGIE